MFETSIRSQFVEDWNELSAADKRCLELTVHLSLANVAWFILLDAPGSFVDGIVPYGMRVGLLVYVVACLGGLFAKPVLDFYRGGGDDE